MTQTHIPLTTATQIPRQEFHPSGNGWHRLIMGEQATPWACYRDYTYLQGYVGATAYYLPKEAVMPADEFCRLTGVTTR